LGEFSILGSDGLSTVLKITLILFFFRDLNSFSYSHVSLINDAKVRIRNYVAKEKRYLGAVFLRKVIKYYKSTEKYFYNIHFFISSTMYLTSSSVT